MTLLLLGAAVLLGACGPSSSGSPAPIPSPAVSPAGGPPSVMGTVTAGPVCPVVSSPPDPQCAPRPVAGAVIVATNEHGDEVGRATSAADGTYQLIAGETGMLRISPQPVTGLVGVPEPVRVTLAGPSEVQRIDFEYDTGIR